MPRITGLGLAAAFVCTTVHASHAATVTYTITGVVGSVYDTTGMYATSLVGQSFTASAVFDLDKAVKSTTIPGVTSYFGGPQYSATPVFGTVDIQFGGFDLQLSGEYYSRFDVTEDSNVNTEIIQRNGYGGGILQAAFSLSSPEIGDGIAPRTISSTLAGSGSYYLQDPTDGSVTYISFDPTLLVITSNVSAVPLPATLPLFGAAVLGLGLFGYGNRRRSGASTS